MDTCRSGRVHGNEVIMSAIEDVWARTEARRKEGKRRAEANKAELREKEYRYQTAWALRNMMKALEIMSYPNTIDNWQRYYEAKYILSIRRSKRKR